MTRKLRRTLRVLTLLLLLYAGLLLTLFVAQRKLIYLPTRTSEARLLADASVQGVEPWRNADGAIIGWKQRAGAGARAANRLVIFHGNAGLALMRTHFIEGFGGLDAGATWEVFLFEYPGFGSRPGALGEKSFITAGRSALDQLAAEDRRPIFLLGESLGSGLACALAADERRVAGVLLITPYTSLADVAQHLYPIVPVRLLLRDRWNSMDALPRFSGRVGVVLAAEDEVIPVTLGRKLFDAAKDPKRLWVFAGATHNGLPFGRNEPWWREVSDFLTDP